MASASDSSNVLQPQQQQRPQLQPQPSMTIRSHISFHEKKFKVETLPEDLQRVYGHLSRDFGDDYALKVVFVIRTAVELHRAWNLTLETDMLLHQIKDEFQLRMTWELGVFKLKFRVEEGRFELHRKVPYDYDSEFQDLYMKIVVALVEGRINVNQALIFAKETKEGKHTAKSGRFLRQFPGRLLLYPLEAATCAVIFFGGDWYDAAVAAACGAAAGLVEYTMTSIGGQATVLIDTLVGIMTGIIGGLFYRFDGQRTCLPAIFLGTLYWFFYGTAFVVGIVEIVNGQLETGVTRFMAVSVKTFVLSLGAGYGLMIVLSNGSYDGWSDQNKNCNSIDLTVSWWRIPLYLLCSVSALGQYRLPIKDYPRALVVQLVGYEVQWQMLQGLDSFHTDDGLDVASANAVGAISAVVTAFAMTWITDLLSAQYNNRILQRQKGKKYSRFDNFMFYLVAVWVRVCYWIGLGRKADVDFLEMEPKLRDQAQELRDPSHARSQIRLSEHEEQTLIVAIIGAENLSQWSVLMPTVYQLVPGSLIARLWFNAIFPPKPIEMTMSTTTAAGVAVNYTAFKEDVQHTAVFANLMVIATSLAIGLIVGWRLVDLFKYIRNVFCSCIHKESGSSVTDSERAARNRKKDRQGFMNQMSADDPDDIIYSSAMLDPILEGEETNDNQAEVDE